MVRRWVLVVPVVALAAFGRGGGGENYNPGEQRPLLERSFTQQALVVVAVLFPLQLVAFTLELVLRRRG